MSRPHPEQHVHGPQNADHELRKAYNAVVEASVAYAWKPENLAVDPSELEDTYRRAFQRHREGDQLAAERWARTAKHLARALWHEAKLSFLEPRRSSLPYLEGATAAEYSLHESREGTIDLLNSVAEHAPPGMDSMPEPMRRFLARARDHLARLEDATYKHELLRAERIKAAHEYGRVLECMALAYEAEAARTKVA
jgi:hypothetical protein